MSGAGALARPAAVLTGAVVVPDCYYYPMTDRPGAVTEALLAFLREARPDA